jgi:hypothetical protein
MKTQKISLGIPALAAGFFLSAISLAQSPVIYRCQLNGVGRTTTGYLVITQADLDKGGTDLQLSDSPEIGDTASEFSSAEITAFPASGGELLLSAVITQHDPGQNSGDKTQDRQTVASRITPIGTVSIRLNGTNGTSFACDLQAGL